MQTFTYNEDHKLHVHTLLNVGGVLHIVLVVDNGEHFATADAQVCGEDGWDTLRFAQQVLGIPPQVQALVSAAITEALYT